MRRIVRLLVICALMFLARSAVAQELFDGNWLTTLSCPAKGGAEAYSWQFASVIQNGDFHGEHGAAGSPGYVLIDGKIANDGSAKLSAKGMVASKKNAQGEAYSYFIDARFRAQEGSGVKSEFLQAVRHDCTFESVKLQPTGQP